MSTSGRPGRPATGRTPTRSIRLGPIYDAALQAAHRRGDRLPAIIEDCLEEYVMTSKRIAEIVDRLNTWDEDHPRETRLDTGVDIWQDVILRLREFDPAATDVLDGVDGNDRFVVRLPAGRVTLRYDAQAEQWYEVR